MKTIIIAVAGLMLVAGVAGAAITNSKHDFSGDAWNTTNTICTPCHAPHSNDPAGQVVLWNHTVTTAPYTFYDSPTMEATQPTVLSSGSTLCMSCHDGTVNLDAFGGAAGSVAISGDELLDTDFTDDHPVGISYCDSATVPNCSAQDVELANRSAIFAGTRTIADFLTGDNLECSSCHDVHNGAEAAAVDEKLLYVTNTSSAICLQCHLK